ncbi:MAG: amino acid ABC transporter substrate-binding protein [Anaerolineae bacterium]
MIRRRFLVVTLILVVAMLGGVASVFAQGGGTQLGPITQRILDRGELLCGANANLPGFGVVNEAGEFSGMDIDICRAVAAAVLGDANAVSFRPLTGAERQAAIQGGEIDIMSRNTTFTLSRDTTWGAIFAPTTFYDGQGVMTRAELGAASLADLDGGAMCVQSGTTTELNITDAITKAGLDIEIVVFPDAPTTWEGYLSGRCDAWTTDKSGLLAYQATAEDPGAHVILPDTLSKEPLGPLTPQSDPQFAEIVAWTIYGMIEAEEQGITSENIDEFMDSEDPVIQRLLGLNDNPSGSYLGIANNFVEVVIRQVGNYGEVFERNLGVPPFNLARGINDLWTRGGLLYAPPFR